MSFVTWIFGIIGVFLLSLIVFKTFRKKERILARFKLFGRRIIIATARKKELFLLVLYIGLFLWWDILQNIILLRGIEYSVGWFGNITTNALDLSIIVLILFHITLMSLFLMSLENKGTHKSFDKIMGTIALFGVAIVLAGFINSLYSETMRFLFINMSSRDFYHIGVAIELVYQAYLLFTK